MALQAISGLVLFKMYYLLKFKASTKILVFPAKNLLKGTKNISEFTFKSCNIYAVKAMCKYCEVALYGI
jgi:hypothetical protein